MCEGGTSVKELLMSRRRLRHDTSNTSIRPTPQQKRRLHDVYFEEWGQHNTEHPDQHESAEKDETSTPQPCTMTTSPTLSWQGQGNVPQLPKSVALLTAISDPIAMRIHASTLLHLLHKASCNREGEWILGNMIAATTMQDEATQFQWKLHPEGPMRQMLRRCYRGPLKVSRATLLPIMAPTWRCWLDDGYSRQRGRK